MIVFNYTTCGKGTKMKLYMVLCEDKRILLTHRANLKKWCKEKALFYVDVAPILSHDELILSMRLTRSDHFKHIVQKKAQEGFHAGETGTAIIVPLSPAEEKEFKTTFNNPTGESLLAKCYKAGKVLARSYCEFMLTQEKK